MFMSPPMEICGAKPAVFIRVWPLLPNDSPSRAAKLPFRGNSLAVDLKPDQRSQASVVSRGQLSTHALGYRESTGKEAYLIETYELEERGAMNP